MGFFKSLKRGNNKPVRMGVTVAIVWKIIGVGESRGKGQLGGHWANLGQKWCGLKVFSREKQMHLRGQDKKY